VVVRLPELKVNPVSLDCDDLDGALACLDRLGYCVIRKIERLPVHLKHFTDGYTSYDGKWRAPEESES
jgi:hypothetical protein